MIDFQHTYLSWSPEETNASSDDGTAASAATVVGGTGGAIAAVTVSVSDKVEAAATGTDAPGVNKGINTLSDINAQITKGMLVCIVGPVGSGKSSLLSSLLVEMHLKKGKLCMASNAAIAYCDQRPFVINATLKDNVLFDSEFDARKFNETVDVSCLEDDIKMLAHGINTEIGERGITLSGGQKAR